VKRIGLLGGMSWESSVEYERVINTAVREKLGGVASADLVVRSFNFADIEALQSGDRWAEAAKLLSSAAADLEAAGAQLIVLCTNTMHRVAADIEAAVSVPMLHIADPTGEAAQAAGVSCVALLGTAYTMSADFYSGRLRQRHGLDVRVPGPDDSAEVHRVIYEELVRGVLNPISRARYLEVIKTMVDTGCQAVVAGCTEIELLVRAEDIDVPLFPTARLHALAAAEWALSGP
jgi:aspartate racemase